MITLTSGERKAALVGLGNFFLTIAELEKDLPNFSYQGLRPTKLRDFVKYASSVEDWITIWRGACSNLHEGASYVKRAVLASSYNIKTLSSEPIGDSPVAMSRVADYARRCADAVYSGPACAEMGALATLSGSPVFFPQLMLESTAPTSYTHQFFHTLTPVWRGETRVRSYCDRCGMPSVTIAVHCVRCRNA